MNQANLPEWWEKLIKQHRQGVGRVFILHENVNDLVYYPSGEGEQTDMYRLRPHPFREMLQHLLAVEGQFGPIFYYSPTRALYQFYLDQNGIHRQVNVDEKKLGGAIKDLPEKATSPLPVVWENFAKKVQTANRAPQRLDHILPQMEEYLEKCEPNYFRMVLVLDFFEKITTAMEEHSNYMAEEITRRWALSDLLKKSQNLVIGLTNALDELPPLLRQNDSQIQLIHIPLPEKTERLQFLNYWWNPVTFDRNLGPLKIAPLEEESVLGDSVKKDNEDPQSEEEVQAKRRKTLADLSKGFRLLNLESLVRMAKVDGPDGMVTMKLYQRHKADLIKDESRKLLQEITDKRGFEQVGGLKYAKDYLEKVARDITLAASDEQKGRSVPKGILLAGPPGTGKTILAEALASKAGMTLVRMGNILGGVVGESESNMSRVLSLLKHLAPVVVFVDEIDQSIGRRVTDWEGDSGVNRRLFAMLLEFMGDNENRGKVLWVGASNRPDLLDEAQLSRFDAVMAILPPYSLDERLKILEVMEGNIKGIKFAPDLKEKLVEVAEKLEGLSGRDIETIVRRAADLTESPDLALKDIENAIKHYKPNADQHKIDAWTIQTLMKVNFTDMMPTDLEAYPVRLRDYVSRAILGSNKSNGPLEECLQLIRARKGDWA